MRSRIVGSHVRITFVNALAAARDVLRTNANLAMVICGVHFDDSRMYDLLDYARRERPDVSFLSVRILEAELPRASREGVELAMRMAGAAAFVDFAAAFVLLAQLAAVWTGYSRLTLSRWALQHRAAVTLPHRTPTGPRRAA